MLRNRVKLNQILTSIVGYFLFWKSLDSEEILFFCVVWAIKLLSNVLVAFTMCKMISMQSDPLEIIKNIGNLLNHLIGFIEFLDFGNTMWIGLTDEIGNGSSRFDWECSCIDPLRLTLVKHQKYLVFSLLKQMANFGFRFLQIDNEANCVSISYESMVHFSLTFW